MLSAQIETKRQFNQQGNILSMYLRCLHKNVKKIFEYQPVFWNVFGGSEIRVARSFFDTEHQTGAKLHEIPNKYNKLS
jgi:hypothetical protein